MRQGCWRLLVAGTLTATAACGGGVEGATDQTAATTPSTSGTVELDRERVDDFLVDVVAGDGGAPLVALSDERLATDGQIFCDALAATGSALEAAVALQTASGTYDGQTHLIDVARRTLCPDLDDQ